MDGEIGNHTPPYTNPGFFMVSRAQGFTVACTVLQASGDSVCRLFLNPEHSKKGTDWRIPGARM